jgi:hypothetical protein
MIYLADKLVGINNAGGSCQLRAVFGQANHQKLYLVVIA